ncbi:MAG: protein kinase, partial [Planctomycetota bacterium]
MNTKACQPEYARAYLRGEFTPAHEQEYLDHLDDCVSCREHLEAVAGGSELLSELRNFLSMNPLAGEQTEAAEASRSDLPDSIQQVVKSLRPTDEPASLGRLDNFEVKGVVGHGAMGIVLKAKDPSLDRIVALKVMNPALAASGAARTRFEREAKAAAAVHHPNVVSIHGVLTSADLPYLVMPYLKGGSLQQRVDEQGPFSITEILRIGSQIAAGLAAAHQQGVVHRDIKPSNIMLDDGVEAAVITDFGLARIVDDATMTRTGVISGTPEFMSPEQARGDAI